jgi:hypothetical protein
MLSPGPAPQPSAAPSDAGDNPLWNSDDERDFLDLQYSPPSPMSDYPGSLNPLVGILSHILDWNSFDNSALDHTLKELPVPIPGPSPQGISLQEAIQVSPPPHIRHRIRYLAIYEKMTYCAFYDITFAKGICNIFKNCKQIWPVKMRVRWHHPLVARRSGFLGTIPFHVNLVFGILFYKPFFRQVSGRKNHQGLMVRAR